MYMYMYMYMYVCIHIYIYICVCVCVCVCVYVTFVPSLTRQVMIDKNMFLKMADAPQGRRHICVDRDIDIDR